MLVWRGVSLGRDDGVAGLVHSSLDALERDLGVTDHDQLTAAEIDLDVSYAADGRNLLRNLAGAVMAMHPGDDVLAGDRHEAFLC